MTPQEQMVKARTGLILDAPFFGSMAMRLELKADPTCETAWTNGKVLGFNPAYIGALSLRETTGLVAHEIVHLLSLHHTRRQSREPRVWNEACDRAINTIVLESGFRLPKGHLRGHPGSAEEIYSGMQDKQQEQGQESDPGKSGEIRDLPGNNGGPPSPAEIAEEEANIKIEAQQAMAIAKASGKMPGNMVLFVNDVLKPVHDWKAELRRFLAQAARNDYSWQRPNPRYAYMGLYLPDLYSEAMPPIVIAVDTSGSVSRKHLAQFTAEMESIKQEAHASQIDVVYCDAVVNHTRIFEPGEPLEIEHKGGGGTSFVPPFAWVSNQGEITPAALIYLTDGECHEFPSAPDYPVLWAILGYYRRFQPPFGEVIHLSR